MTYNFKSSLVALCVLASLLGPRFSSPAYAQDQVQDASQAAMAVGWVTSLSGSVYARKGANQPRQKLEVGQEVFNGMTLETGRNAAVRVLFKGDNVLTISQNTKLTITKYLSTPQKTETLFDLVWGRVRAAVASRIVENRDTFEIRTKNAVAGVRGSLLGVSYDRRQNITQSGCGDGNCYVRVGEQTVTIPIGQILSVVNEVIGQPVPLQAGQPGSFNSQTQYDQDGGGENSPADQALSQTGEGTEIADYDTTQFPITDLDPLIQDNVPDGPGTLYQRFYENPQGGNNPPQVHPPSPGDDCCGSGGTTFGPGE